jgi:hypothetical protein
MKKTTILICLAALGITGIIQVLYGIDSAIRIDSHYRSQIFNIAARSDAPTESISLLAGHISAMEAMWDGPILVGGLTLSFAVLAFILFLRRETKETK